MRACQICDDGGWVCERHPDRPFKGTSITTRSCTCGGAGMPCRDCNAESSNVR